MTKSLEVLPIAPGTITQRAAIVLQCVLAGWKVVEHDEHGTLLVDPDHPSVYVVPPEVMQLLVVKSRAIKPATFGSALEH